MDITRAALIGVIVVVSYYLLLQFSGTETQGGLEKSTDIQTKQIRPLNDSKSSLSDIPISPSSQRETSEVGVDDVVSSVGDEKTFSIETDVLSLLIDARSGAFISAELKNIFTEKDGDVPVKVFGKKRGGSYLANSGFFTRNNFIEPNFNIEEIVEAGEGKRLLILSGQSDGYLLTKKITTFAGKYYLEVEDLVEQVGIVDSEISPYSRITREGGAVDTGRFNYSHQGPVFSTSKEKFEKFDYGDLEEDVFAEESRAGWFGFLEPYFMSSWVPDQTKIHTYQGKELNKRVVLTAAGPGFNPKGGVYSSKSTLFVGPRLTNQLKEVQKDLRLVVDYGFLWWIAQPMYWVLDWFHGVFNNWGMAIIFLTLVTKAILWPLTANQYRSMGDMRRIQPQMEALKEKHPNPEDRTKMSQEMMALYKKEGVNPLSSCLPLILQMPFFVAVYWVLMESVELRHAPFYGWITDLTARDPYFVLAILNGGLMWYTQKLTPTPPSNDPVQANMMKFMPVIFAGLFAFFPAGFVLYFFVNTAVTVVQQLWYQGAKKK